MNKNSYICGKFKTHKMTAVEWLVNKILMPEQWRLPEWVIDVINQAKEKEKEQIINFGKRVADNWGMVDVPKENIEQYYNKTFKSE